MVYFLIIASSEHHVIVQIFSHQHVQFNSNSLFLLELDVSRLPPLIDHNRQSFTWPIIPQSASYQITIVMPYLMPICHH